MRVRARLVRVHCGRPVSGMFKEYFFRGTLERKSGAWAGFAVFLLHQCFKAWLKWALNDWYRSFYDVLQSSAQPGSGEIGKPSKAMSADPAPR